MSGRHFRGWSTYQKKNREKEEESRISDGESAEVGRKGVTFTLEQMQVWRGGSQFPPAQLTCVSVTGASAGFAQATMLVPTAPRKRV